MVLQSLREFSVDKEGNSLSYSRKIWKCIISRIYNTIIIWCLRYFCARDLRMTTYERYGLHILMKAHRALNFILNNFLDLLLSLSNFIFSLFYEIRLILMFNCRCITLLSYHGLCKPFRNCSTHLCWWSTVTALISFTYKFP